ncbi:MAG: GNAT family N-acetyltransferase [Thermoplasmata archaeon]
MLRFRDVDVRADRELLLELHCRINYESETPLARTMPYDAYRKKWLSTSQTERFLSDLRESLGDERTIAEILEDDGEVIGYVWVTFMDIEDYDITAAEVMDIMVTLEHGRQGIGSKLMERIKELAAARGASVIRSDTGIENVASRSLHEKHGFRPYRIHYEKVLSDVSLAP